MTLLTMARYEWFEEWNGTKLGKRGQDYLDLKNSMAKELLEWALTVFPQLRDKVCVLLFVGATNRDGLRSFQAVKSHLVIIGNAFCVSGGDD